MTKKGTLELSFAKQGRIIAGCDEVGRGCLAGPVYAAAVVLDYERLQELDDSNLKLVRDSKTLSSRQRQAVIPVLNRITKSSSVQSASVKEIESLGIVQATFLAMSRAFNELETEVDCLLIDGNKTNPLIPVEQIAIVSGDSSCFAIAAASILAKESRDCFMRDMARQYPQFGFEDNVGYGTKSHLTALTEYGITPLHRRNFAPISNYVKASISHTI